MTPSADWLTVLGERIESNRYPLSGGSLEEEALLEALRPQVSRPVFDAAVAEVCEARRARAGGGGSGGGGGGENAAEVSPGCARGLWSLLVDL